MELNYGSHYSGDHPTIASSIWCKEAVEIVGWLGMANLTKSIYIQLLQISRYVKTRLSLLNLKARRGR